MKITTRNGHAFLIDEQDLPLISKYNWFGCKPKGKHKTYILANYRVNGRKTILRLHRFLLQAKAGEQVDHINGDARDNRRENLRLCQNYQNCRNRGKTKSNSSGYKGVSWHKKSRKWLARIGVYYHLIHLGSFSNPASAASAYNKAAKIYHKNYARLNDV